MSKKKEAGVEEWRRLIAECLNRHLFCGRRHNKIKGLVWEIDGFLLLYKRLSDGYFRWPKYAEDVRKLTQEQFIDLMEGSVIRPVTIIFSHWLIAFERSIAY